MLLLHNLSLCNLRLLWYISALHALRGISKHLFTAVLYLSTSYPTICYNILQRVVPNLLLMAIPAESA